MDLSVVVPIYNESANLEALHQELHQALEPTGLDYEVVFVDDGSRDDSFAILARLAGGEPRDVVVRLRKNFGQTAAMSAGFDHASGKVVVTMDGDLQNDPRDIPKLLAKLAEGYDIAAGWRHDRQDKWLTRKLPSKAANGLISLITQVKLHDYGCTLKAFKAEVIQNVRLYGELHRFIPAIASLMGVSIAEVKVNHRQVPAHLRHPAHPDLRPVGPGGLCGRVFPGPVLHLPQVLRRGAPVGQARVDPGGVAAFHRGAAHLHRPAGRDAGAHLLRVPSQTHICRARGDKPPPGPAGLIAHGALVAPRGLTLKLIYDLRLLTGQMHGMARYALELLRALLDQDPELQVGALVRKPEHAAMLPADKRVLAMACNLAPYGVASQLNLPKLLDGLRPEVYHCPFYAPPARFKGPMVFTVHDLIHLRFPADHGLKHRLFYLWVVSPAAKRAQVVFTPSQHSKKDLVELMGVPEEKIVVTPNAAGQAFRPPPAPAAPPPGLPESYVLGVGNPKPHKNLGALVEAHRRLRAKPPAGVAVPPLVVVGAGPGAADWARPSDQLVLIPTLDDAALAQAYGAARAVVVPSLYEGFGLPALEAMACGAPVVAADRASLPEVVGEAGLLSGPDADSLAQAMGRVLAEPELAQRLREAGLRRAARFSWAETARTTLKVYRRVAARFRV